MRSKSNAGPPGSDDVQADLDALHTLLTEHADELFPADRGRSVEDEDHRFTRLQRRVNLVLAVAVAAVLAAGLPETAIPRLRGEPAAISIAVQDERGAPRIDWSQVQGASHYVVSVWNSSGETLVEEVVQSSKTYLDLPAAARGELDCQVEAWAGPDWIADSEVTRVDAGEE